MIKNILLLIVTITVMVVALIIGEIVVGLAVDGIKTAKKCKEVRGNRGKWKKDEILHHTHVPGEKFNSIAEDGKEFNLIAGYNSKGLNDYEYDYEKPENTIRIVVFGDSFVEAVQVERKENFCKVLEESLNSLGLNKKYEVINMGVSAYSPILEYTYLKEEGLKYKPDMVILCFFVNDVHDDMSYKGGTLFDKDDLPLKVAWKEPDRTKQFKGWKRFERELCSNFKKLLRRSKVYVFLKKKIYQLLAVLNLKELEPESESMFVLYDKVSEKEESAWGDTLHYIEGTKNLANTNDARFLLVTIPLQEQLRDNAKLESMRFYFVGNINSERSEKRIRDFCKENNISYVSLLKEFKKRKTPNPYFLVNGHFNSRGHKEVAGIILDEIKSSGFLNR